MLMVNLRVTINAEKGSGRYLEVTPSALVLGTSGSATLAVMSHNGPTVYELYGDGEFGWAKFDKMEGVIPEYNSADAATIETITLTADRTGLAAGDYNFTLIIRSDLGDYTVPVTMTVEEGGNPGSGDSEILSCSDDLVFTLTGCKISGTTATIDMTVKNVGNKTISLDIKGGSSNGYAYDDQGNKYAGSNVQVSIAGGSYSSWNSYTDIPAGIMTNGSIRFYNVDANATEFMNITVPTNQEGSLIFKNVKIRK